MENGSGNAFRQPASQTAPPAHPQAAGLENIPVNQLHTWNFSHKSQIDDKVYEGQFTTKKLAVMELSRLGVRKVQLNGGFHFDEEHPGQGIDENIDSMNSMVAHLEVSLIQAPIWFDLDKLIDPMILQLVYREVARFENNFFRPRRESAESGRSVPNDSSGESQESGSAGHVEAVGGSEVQPSVDP